MLTNDDALHKNETTVKIETFMRDKMGFIDKLIILVLEKRKC